MVSKIQSISSRLRKIMKDDKKIYPDQRGTLNPYSLICYKCGNTKLFYYDEIRSVLITIQNGELAYDFGKHIKKVNKNDRISIIAKKHMEMGAGTSGGLVVEKDNVRCARCGSHEISLYGDILTECQNNRCVGCFHCGGAYNEDNILDHCVQCVEIRKRLDKDPSVFTITLDMDLYCDACPIQALRESYGIEGEEIRLKVSGHYPVA